MDSTYVKYHHNYDDSEGYVYSVYGKTDYLKHVLTSLHTLRRFDQKRPVALVCEEHHVQLLNELGLRDLFDVIHLIDPDHRTIVGFKHNVDSYLFFKSNIFLDSDIIWCKNPDDLWKTLSVYDFTITGNIKSDIFFGSHKNFSVLLDLLFSRRRRTLKRFGLSYLSRVQSGIIFAKDKSVTHDVCQLARGYMDQKDRTHFISRKLPNGNTEESDEWGFAMAMSRLKLPVIPWFQGELSPQLDFISSFVDHDPDFKDIRYLYYLNKFVYSLRGLQSQKTRENIMNIMRFFRPSSVEYKWVTPYSIHFSWKHDKIDFYEFSDRIWEKYVHSELEEQRQVKGI